MNLYCIASRRDELLLAIQIMKVPTGRAGSLVILGLS
jgi:hypothetical protein